MLFLLRKMNFFLYFDRPQNEFFSLFWQTPESDVEEVKANSNVSFGEFLKQYKELSDWLKTIQTALQQKAASTLALSEKYLNQVYLIGKIFIK